MKNSKQKQIYNKLIYYCWCVRFEKDDILSIKTLDEFSDFLKYAEEHSGDCLSESASCPRCHLHECEIEAQKLYNYLFKHNK